jgi:hypothetical protein
VSHGDPPLPHEAKHDYAVARVHEWRDRSGSEEQYDLTVLGITAGMVIDVEMRDGSRHVGKVRQRSDGHGWWMPEEHDGRIVLDPGGVAIVVTDIVAIAAQPDPTWAHDSDPHPPPEA